MILLRLDFFLCRIPGVDGSEHDGRDVAAVPPRHRAEGCPDRPQPRHALPGAPSVCPCDIRSFSRPLSLPTPSCFGHHEAVGANTEKPGLACRQQTALPSFSQFGTWQMAGSDASSSFIHDCGIHFPAHFVSPGLAPCHQTCIGVAGGGAAAVAGAAGEHHGHAPRVDAQPGPAAAAAAGARLVAHGACLLRTAVVPGFWQPHHSDDASRVLQSREHFSACTMRTQDASSCSVLSRWCCVQ